MGPSRLTGLPLRPGRRGGRSSRAPESAAIRVLAIRRPGRTPPAHRAEWALIDCRSGREAARWGSYESDAELLELPLDGSAGEPTQQLAYLVCTHSKHDTCCALRGRNVAMALHEVRPGLVWECSHVGGERFAANVLVLPTGLLYGRVLPFAAAEFVAAAEAGEVVGALLRGRIGLPPAAQAALAFAYEHLAVRQVDAVRLVHAQRVPDGQAIVRLSGPHGLHRRHCAGRAPRRQIASPATGLGRADFWAIGRSALRRSMTEPAVHGPGSGRLAAACCS